MTGNESELLSALTGVVLAGGENRRFPFLKGLIPVQGSTIMERSLQLMEGIFVRVLVSTNAPEVYFPFGAPMVGDILKAGGPMSGLHASLIQGGQQGIFVTGCDMPFVKEELIRFICRRHEEASRQGNWEATVAVCHGRPQPLIGVYTPSLIPRLEEGIREGKNSLRRFLREVRTCFVAEEEVRRIDAEGLSFVNINTVEDYERVMGSGLTLLQ